MVFDGLRNAAYYRARMEVVPVTAPDYYREHIDTWSAYPEHAAMAGLVPDAPRR